MGKREKLIRVGAGVTLLVVVGALGGVASLFGSGHKKPKAATDAAPRQASADETARNESTGHGLSLEDLKERIRRMHPGVDVDKALEEAEQAIDITALPLAERKQRMDRALANHFREAWDATWGSTTENRLTSEFTAVGYESGFEVAKVECRTSSCLVTVQWQAPEMADAIYESLVATPVGLGCRLEMLPPRTGAREAPIFLDCAKERKASTAARPMVATVTGAVPTWDENTATGK